MEFQPVVSRELIAATNALRQNLLALGLESKAADEILDLRRYLELKAKEKSAEKRAKKTQEGRSQAGKASDIGEIEAASQAPADSGQKRDSERPQDEKSPGGEGSDIGLNGDININEKTK